MVKYTTLQNLEPRLTERVGIEVKDGWYFNPDIKKSVNWGNNQAGPKGDTEQVGCSEGGEMGRSLRAEGLI